MLKLSKQCKSIMAKNYMCVSGFPTLHRFLSDPKHFIVNFEENIVKYAEKLGGGVER